jgi:hypothetical protein
MLVPNTVAIDAIKNDALYFGLPEDANIKEANKSLFLKNLGKLWKKLKSMKAALWAVDKYLTYSESFSKNETRVCMQDCNYAIEFMNSGSDRSKLIAAINNVILSLKEWWAYCLSGICRG